MKPQKKPPAPAIQDRGSPADPASAPDPESFHRLMSAAFAALGGAAHMNLDEWRTLEQEIEEDSPEKARMTRSHGNLLMASLTALPAYQLSTADTDWFPAVDIMEAGEEYLVEVDLPGLRPDQVRLKVDSGVLSISGERVPLDRGGKSLRVERPSGAFVRHLPLPQDAHGGEMRFTLRDGVLELHLPRNRPDKHAA